jgi:hypothetical protein
VILENNRARSGEGCWQVDIREWQVFEEPSLLVMDGGRLADVKMTTLSVLACLPADAYESLDWRRNVIDDKLG